MDGASMYRVGKGHNPAARGNRPSGAREAAKASHAVLEKGAVIHDRSAGEGSLHLSSGSYCGHAEGRVYFVALGRAPRRIVEYASGALPARALYPRPSAHPRYETR